MLAKKKDVWLYINSLGALFVLQKNGTSFSIEHATEIASLIGDRWGADKYKSKKRNREDVSEHNLMPIWKLL